METIATLLNVSDSFTQEVKKCLETLSNFAYWLEKEFLQEHDYCNVRGESNVIRYLPVKGLLLRCDEADTLYEILSSIAAAKMCGASLHLSIANDATSEALLYIKKNRTLLLDAADRFAEEDETSLIDEMRKADRIRFLHPDNVTKSMSQALAEDAVYIASEPFIGHGRIELMHYFREQSVSNSYHRYGNLGLKGLIEKEI